MLTRTTVDGYAGTCAALRDADLTESTRALKLPVLCIVGDQGRVDARRISFARPRI